MISQYAYGRERSKAHGKVVKFVMPRLPMVIRNRRLVYELVAERFGKNVRYEELAIRFKKEPSVIERYAKAVKDCVTEVSAKAELIGTDGLRERGIID